MRVELDLLDHPKYLQIRAEFGAASLEYLIRLWGHCQSSQRGSTWVGADSNYVEVVCRYKKRDGELFAALAKVRFIDPIPGGVRIHDWDEFNGRAVSNWHNGKKGGRPKEGNEKNHRVNPVVNPTETKDENGEELGEPLANPKQTLMSERVSERVSERSAGSSPPEEPPEIPSEAEVVAAASIEGIPPEFAVEFHVKKSVSRYWLNTRGELIDWRRDLRHRWVLGRPTWRPQGGGHGRSADVESLARAVAALAESDPRRPAAVAALIDARAAAHA